MKQLKRIISLMLVLAFVLAAVPSASAWKLSSDGTSVYADNFSDITRAFKDSKIKYVYMTGSVTISNSITIPEGVHLYSDYDVSVPAGVTVTASKDSAINLHGVLNLNGTLSMQKDSYIHLYKSIGGNRTGKITGSGTVNTTTWNDDNYNGTTTSVVYSNLDRVSVASTIYQYHYLRITIDRFNSLKTSPEFYDSVTLYASSALTTLTINKSVHLQNVMLSQRYNYYTEKYMRPKLVVKDGGTLTIDSYLDTNSCTTTVEKGGKISAKTIYVNGGSSKNYPSSSVTVNDGGQIQCERLSLSSSTEGLTPARVTVYGTLKVTDYISNKGVIRSCGTFTRGNYYYGDGKIYSPFFDTEDGAWYTPQIVWAVKNGITTGVDKTNFGPEQTCTRAQVVTFLWRAAGSPSPKTSSNPFKDVKSSDYYYKAVLWAVENGITTGVDNTHFAPETKCTRGQVVTFLYRASNSPSVGSSSNPFKDVKSGAYYYNAVLWANKKGITTGVSSTSFAPDNTCTRAQIVTFLYRNAN